MKRFYAIVLAIFYFQYASAQANKSLSNLNAVTAVNVSLLPKATGSIDLGASANRWRNIYFNGGIFYGSYRAMTLDTSYLNTAVGQYALHSNTTGTYNIANGLYALHSNTSGYLNTANGVNTLKFNISGNYNTANGAYALYSNTTGNNNTANGYSALKYNTIGYQNVAHGSGALRSNTSGNSNTANGYSALYSNITGSNNTALGYNADVSAGNLSNATALGYDAVTNASNKVRIGNTAVTSIGGQVNWTTFSDGRYKKNIQEDVKGLSFIKALRPVTYITDIKALNAYYHTGRGNDSTYKTMQTEMALAIEEGSKIVYTGFVAQEVEAAAKQLGYDFSGVDKPKTKDGIYGLRYSDFVVPLVKAVQELSKMNDDKDAAIDSLKKQNEILNARLDKIEKLLTRPSQNSANFSSKVIELNNASLAQNSPNPFTNTTTIAYSLPQKFSSAKIIITDKNGKQLKQLNLSGAGKGTVHIDASTFASGAYNYALYVDGKSVVSNQMLLAR